MIEKAMIHFIEKSKIILKQYSHYIPRIDDCIRVDEDKFYSVNTVYWCYDEGKPRVNIGVSKVIFGKRGAK